MNCQDAFDRYLALDKNEWVPLSVTMHLIVCPSCRTGVRLMTKAERAVASPLAPSRVTPGFFSPELSPSRSHSDDPVIAAAMARIQASGLAYQPVERHVSLMRWLVAGILLAAGFAVLPFSFLGDWSKVVFGTSYSVPFYLVSGIIVAIYGGLFIGTNIDFFVKKYGFEHTAGYTA